MPTGHGQVVPYPAVVQSEEKGSPGKMSTLAYCQHFAMPMDMEVFLCTANVPARDDQPNRRIFKVLGIPLHHERITPPYTIRSSPFS
ncbi:hypothetical protein Aam_066_005 [Acidocella aminolytica 101 = DSM 11237]|uniref:Uncharacterized protein n=1 Tax=Acidocella aminolytica 101 = DSM 11237 TaxID=1120923 RepID=A0A0D6PHT3_9PROT|nr:hypothetical protein Aam_066_005 [Acidocella aminolytica 101 = DSM 11237]